MRIRWKLLVLLLVIAVVPLIGVSVLAQRAQYRLGRDLGEEARAALTRRAEAQLGLVVESHAMMLRKQSDLVRVALMLQAREAERCLALDPPRDARVYYADDFDAADDPPPGMTTATRYARSAADGSRAPLPISTSVPDVRIAPGVDRESVRDDALRLTQMAPCYRRLWNDVGDLLYWQHTSLENGVHVCFPGHGGYPPDYDHRNRYWYRVARMFTEPKWTAPYLDISVRRAVITAAVPIHRPDGSLAGVAAIDAPVADVIGGARFPELPNSVAFIVVVVPRDEFDPAHPRERDLHQYTPEQLALFIVAQPHHDADESHGSEPFQAAWLSSTDHAPFRAMLADMMRGESGVRKMPYKDSPSLWAYGPMLDQGAYLVVAAPVDELMAEGARAEQMVVDKTAAQLRITGFVLAVVCAIVTIIAFAGSRAVTRPVRRLAAAARQLAAGDFSTSVDLHRRDELGDLGRAFNEIGPQLQDRMKLRQSLSLAMEVQQHLLPAEPPKVAGLDIAGRSVYCDETGGDYYDFLDLSQLSPHSLGIAVGDVTGHGIAAALMMTGARALLRSRADQPGMLTDLMGTINRHLTADTPVGRFKTLFFMVADTRDHSVRWANAGHDPPIVYDPARDTFTELKGSDIPLGIDGTWTYHEFRHEPVEPGRVIVIGTDGIWESRNDRGEFFGKEGLRDVIRRQADASADRISGAIIDALARHRSGFPQEDDVTLVVVKVLA